MQQLRKQLHLLTDETRFKIIQVLMEHDLCVGALARHLNISSAAVSQHLRLLQESGFVRGEKRGYWTHYAVEKDSIIEIAEELKKQVIDASRQPSACRKGKGCPNITKKDIMENKVNCCFSPPEK